MENNTPKKEKVIPMSPGIQGVQIKVSPEEQEILDKAKAIQEKKMAEAQAEEDAIIADLVAKHNLGRDEIDVAVEVERELSDPKTGVQTMTAALDYYKDLTHSQACFLAINANSKANHMHQSLHQYQNRIAELEKQLETIMVAQKLEMEAREGILNDEMVDAIAEESAKEALGTIPEGE
jgi:hypothetical protein